MFTLLFFAAPAPPTSTASASVAWLVTDVLASLLVGAVAFYGSQRPAPVGLGLGFYPALFLGAGGAAVTFFGLFGVFRDLGLI
ncbi:hypothetical protein [Streptomyces ortus]|uniref:Uncharacterized protein n=1 Tax=Streptomyces ortus TaxID=2867268 RepID=A0ABT3UYN8_9ACTN|nr:hypothetical protein [Streptomyces ortus]MCX4231799.1 hypothetical protein [Streptomyces ortus]